MQCIAFLVRRGEGKGFAQQSGDYQFLYWNKDHRKYLGAPMPLDTEHGIGLLIFGALILLGQRGW